MQGRAGREGQGRAGQGRAGQGSAGQGRAGQGRAGQGRAGQGRAGQSRAKQPHLVSFLLSREDLLVQLDALSFQVPCQGLVLLLQLGLDTLQVVCCLLNLHRPSCHCPFYLFNRLCILHLLIYFCICSFVYLLIIYSCMYLSIHLFTHLF